METNELIPFVEPIPEENSLVRKASSGEVDAFIQLFEAYSDDLYRYVYFRVLSDVAAEAITSQVFRHAWDNLGQGLGKGKPFIAWIYELARNQVIVYYTANLRSHDFDIGSLLSAPDYRLAHEIPDWTHQEAWGSHLRLLTGDIEQSRLQSTAALIMRKYLDYLNPGSRSRPSPTFNAYTRAWLIRYMYFHPRGRAPVMMTAAPQRPHFRPTLSMARRLAVTVAMLAFALVVSGTAQAQSALPGDPLYTWKRTSEQAMLSLSPDPVGTKLFIADRRLDELISVEKDPRRSAGALDAYSEALTALSTTEDPQTIQDRVVPVLEAHRKKIAASGLASSQIQQLLTVAVTAIPSADEPVLVLTPTEAAAAAVPTDILQPTALPSTLTSISTEALPTAITEPTDIPPTATATATDVPTATATATATEVPPSPTATEIAPTPTDIPTDTVPTDAPTPATIDPFPTEPGL